MKSFKLIVTVGVFFSAVGALAYPSNEEALAQLHAFLNLNDQSTRVYQGNVAHFPLRHRPCTLTVAPKADGLEVTLVAPRRVREFVVTASGRTACGETNQVKSLCSDADCCGESIYIESQVSCGKCPCDYETIELTRSTKGHIQAATVKNSRGMVLHCVF